ncbi:circadian clock protein KaiC [Burkholderia sp. 22PA0099]|uniref:circadian clock protein KaiC n=1 Tax=Burkholderia sp. 22PA0099 TaxID=3237372 RepID=UPI0039C09045
MATFHPSGIPKTPTGIAGFDQLTHGGLPRGRSALLCGAAGCGKTLFAMTFLVEGATRYDEPGVFVSFEERSEDLAANVASLGYDVAELANQNRLLIDHIELRPSETDETPDYDLEGLFIRLDVMIRKVKARRVVIDTIETLFASFNDASMLRSELRRLFGWLKERGVTAIVTGERGDGTLTRYGIEEYVSDCVIVLDNRVRDQVTTRRLRVVKYRGSAHGTNEYPFLIDAEGITVLPITSASLDHPSPEEILPTGIAGIDRMLDGGGIYRGSSVLISGLAGTGKTTFAAAFAQASCERGERVLFFEFEESPAQVIRNLRSVGIDLGKFLGDQLRFESARPSLFGLEMHLARMYRDIEKFDPSLVVIDPLSAFRGLEDEVHAVFLRLIDMLKARGTTCVFTSLVDVATAASVNDRSVSSLMDVWVALFNTEANGERNRTLYVLKARGMAHSNQIREYTLSSDGIELVPAYIGAGGVLTGAARVSQESRERAEAAARMESAQRAHREAERKRQAIKRQIAELQASLNEEDEEASAQDQVTRIAEETASEDRETLARRRGA